MSSATLDRSGLIEKAASLVQRGDLTGALRHYVRLFEESPSDWNVANALGDLYVRLGKTEDAIAHFISLAEQLAADGFTAKARALYRKILRIQPTNAAALQRVEELDRHGQSASPFLQRVLETARAARETAPAEPPAIETPPPPPAAADPWNSYVPEPVSAAAAPPQPLPPPPPPPPADSTPPEPQVISELPDAQASDEFTITEAAVDLALRRQDFAGAIAAIEQFLLTHPHDTRALERLIEIGVDGSRTAELPWAQVRLAEACLEVGRYQQAQDVAIDLIFREPGSTRHQDLLERVTTAAREHRESLRRVPELEAPCEPVTPVVEPEVPVAQPPAPPAIRLVEKRPAASPPAPPPAADGDLPPDLREWSDPLQALEDIRTVLVEEAAAAAEERLAEAQRFIDAADVEHAVRALEEAMCAPHLRAPAGARLAALYREVGAPLEALACLEWVAEMPPPNEDSGHELAYQLALTLEALGQQAQALGVYRELLAEVGPAYRDIASRTERLAVA